MSQTYQVMLGDAPLTVTIADQKRAEMAYNLMYAIADGKAEHGDAIVSINGQDIPMTVDDLHVVDTDGNSFKPELDPEWYGTEADNDKVKEIVLDKLMEEAALDGEELDREFEAEMQEQYRVCSWAEDHTSIRFMPFVWDMDKVNEMYNCLTYGVDPSVSISVVNDFDERVTIRPDNLGIVNEDGDVYGDEPEPEWALNGIDPSICISAADEQDFADAVAAIPTDEKGLEQ